MWRSIAKLKTSSYCTGDFAFCTGTFIYKDEMGIDGLSRLFHDFSSQDETLDNIEGIISFTSFLAIFSMFRLSEQST
jgi:hypothetical protein